MFYRKRFTCTILFILAHGENWEVAAMHVVSDLARKMNQGQISNRESTEQGDSLGLHATPTICTNIPLANLTKPPNEHSQTSLKQDS